MRRSHTVGDVARMHRTYASELLDGGADVVSTQRLMGHSDPATTAKYDRRPERANRGLQGLNDGRVSRSEFG